MPAEGARWASSAEEHWEVEEFGSLGFHREESSQKLIKPQGKLTSCNISICFQS